MRIINFTNVLILLLVSYAICLRSVPNIEDIILGRDMQIGQLSDANSVKNPIFDTLTYNKHKIVILNETTYLVPDQINIIDYSTEEQSATSEVYTSQLILQESMSVSYSSGYDSWFSPGMFSESSNAYYFHELYQANAEYMASSYLRVTNYKASVDSEIKLNPFFEQQLLALPCQYNETTCPHFKNFFGIFGTNYVYSCIFGGVVEMETSFSIEVLQNTTIESVENDLSTQFFLMTTTETLTEEQQEQLTQLNAVYKSTFKLFGGDPSKYNATNYQPWIATTLSDPFIVSMEIYNFTTLLHKNYTQNKQKIEALNAAIKEYFYSSYKNWQTISTVPVSLNIKSGDIPVYVVIDDTVYFPVSLDYNPGYYYNMKSNLWFEMTPLPASLMSNYISRRVTCTAVQDTIYCFGEDEKNYDFSYAYNTKTAIWTELNNCWNKKSHYLVGGATSVAVNTSVRILGGSGGGYAYGYSWCLNFTTVPYPVMTIDTVTEACSELYLGPECVVNYKSIVVNNLIYTIGGRQCQIYATQCDNKKTNTESDFCCNMWYVMSNSTYKFDILHNVWTELAQMPVRLYNPAITTFENKIYVMGGSIIDEYVQFYPLTYFPPAFKPNYVIYEYDTITNVWSIVNNNSAETASMGIAFNYEGFLFFMSDKINVMSPNNFC